MVDYQEVLADLRSKREALSGIIIAIEALTDTGNVPVKAVPITKEIVKSAPALRVKLTKPRVSDEDDESGKRDVPFMTITEAILKAVAELPRTSIEVFDRVEQLRPGSARPSIQAALYDMLRSGKLHKDDALKIRSVVGNRIAS